MATKLYVGGLAYSTTEDELKTLFGEHGNVVSVAIIKDRDTNQSKGFGFVEFAEASEAQAAISNLNGKEFGGRSLMVNEARPKEDRPSGGGGGSFRRSY
ncbi:MAG: RNA-binding protein [Candidatus Saccharimonadales bacterium]